MKRILKRAALLLAVLFAVLAYNTLKLPPATSVASASQIPPTAAPLLAVDAAAAAQRLAGAVRIPTISYEDRGQIDPAQFEAFAAYLEKTFPRVHAALGRERVGTHSLLYTWRGRDPAAAPVLLLAHMDVVPVEPGTESRWTHPPFGGEIAEGYVWGRGALDDKSSLIGWMEAAELLLAQGFVPQRTVYLAFGHDEEIGGRAGARQIAALLKSRGVRAEYALDEGGVITQGIVGSVSKPVASIMAAEKGYASFRLTARGAGGHSSMPPRETAVGELARAVAHLRDHPMPPRLAAPTTDMLDRLAPEMPLAKRLVVSNRWLFGPLLMPLLEESPVTDALIRTTTAPTMLRAGIKDNVLPSEAYAVVNFRLLPGDTVADVEHHIHMAVADDRIEVRREGDFGNDASPVSDTGADAFRMLERSVHEVFPDAVVTTGIVLGATDLRNYSGLYDNRYNFAPSVYGPADLARVHGTDERIAVTAYADMVRYYARVLQNSMDLP